ncbi:MAG: hypothetical protein NC191_08795 [Muribaculaceae bacterium]|nr:hypothetical protein [Muribaculaceae bacterium]
MQKRILTASILTVLIISTTAYAVIIGDEPPAQYINNLRTCTKSTIKRNDTVINKYIIKGKLPNGRCEVYTSSYTNFADPKVYETFKSITKMFSEMANEINKSKSQQQITKIAIPTQEQMIQQAQKEKEEIICKFSEKERKALYEAYQKHDSTNPPGKIENGNVSFSFDTSKMSSYDKLMLQYENYGPCKKTNEQRNSFKKYVCKYADTTCYVTTEDDYSPSISCSQKDDSFNTLYTNRNKVLDHVKQNLCEQIF